MVPSPRDLRVRALGSYERVARPELLELLAGDLHCRDCPRAHRFSLGQRGGGIVTVGREPSELRGHLDLLEPGDHLPLPAGLFPGADGFALQLRQRVARRPHLLAQLPVLGQPLPVDLDLLRRAVREPGQLLLGERDCGFLLGRPRPGVAHHAFVDVVAEQLGEQVLAVARLVVQEAGELVLRQHDRAGEVLEREAEQRFDGTVDLAGGPGQHVAVDLLQPRFLRARTGLAPPNHPRRDVPPARPTRTSG